jgi:hypothetical protein
MSGLLHPTKSKERGVRNDGGANVWIASLRKKQRARGFAMTAGLMSGLPRFNAWDCHAPQKQKAWGSQ